MRPRQIIPGMIFLVAFIFQCFPDPAQASVIHVPFDYPTIQGAINAAIDGDAIQVSAGTYIENVNFLGKAIIVTSTDGPATTIINGNNAGSVVTFTTGEGLDSVLSGFTIQNGNANFGAGVTISGASPTIIGNTFDSNIEGGGGFGAGIGGNGSSATIERNEFRNNSCDSQYLSGVVSFVNSSSPKIVNNIFSNNPCRGINMTLPTNGFPLVLNNTIIGNTVGIRVDRRISTIQQNYHNNIIVGNGIGLEIDFGTESNNPTWGNNLVFGNTTNYGGISDQTGANRNISGDPLFVDPLNNDFHLQAGSPAIDTGDNTASGLPATDIEGNNRILDGNNDGIAVVDIGAYEFVSLFNTTRYEENDQAITYTGIWNHHICAACSGGGLTYSGQLGANALFSFNGTGIKWIMTKTKMMGKANVYLDGVFTSLVDLYSLTPQFQVVWEQTGLSPGIHSVSVQVSGKKNPSATAFHIDLDAFEVVP